MNDSNAAIHIIEPGLFSTLQDKGRFGLRHLGIPWAGALCPAWQILANALVGNSLDQPIIECFEGGLCLKVCGPAVKIAVLADHSCRLKIRTRGTETTINPNRAISLEHGSEVQILSSGALRHAVISIEAINVQAHLGSVSTYVKAALGGLDGCTLKRGSVVPYHSREKDSAFLNNEKKPDQQCLLPPELLYKDSHIRVIPGPQLDYFSESGVNTLLSDSFKISSEADRMGVRLDGPLIAHRDDAAKDIVSDAIVPGSIQVPGTGRPIVLLNDAHTAGGYPKIATVISSDLPKLGLQRAGSPIQFSFVSVQEAHTLRHSEKELVMRTLDTFQPCVQNRPHTRALLENNLIDGVTDGSSQG